MQDKLAEAQRKELDLNDQLQLYHDQLEATKVVHCSSGKNSVWMRACVCVVIKLAAIHMNVAYFCWRVEFMHAQVAFEHTAVIYNDNDYTV